MHCNLTTPAAGYRNSSRPCAGNEWGIPMALALCQSTSNNRYTIAIILKNATKSVCLQQTTRAHYDLSCEAATNTEKKRLLPWSTVVNNTEHMHRGARKSPQKNRVIHPNQQPPCSPPEEPSFPSSVRFACGTADP